MGKLWHQCGSVKRRKLELLYAVHQEAKIYYLFYIVKVLLFILVIYAKIFQYIVKHPN